MILTPSQAKAVYSAMCALNNVGAICGDLTLAEGLRVQWLASVTVREGLSGPREEYPNQPAFATAYGLQPGQRHYAVTGRICGDEEDTLLLVRGKNHEEAVEAFKDELRAIRNVDAEDQDETEIFIGAVVWSNTPINE